MYRCTLGRAAFWGEDVSFDQIFQRVQTSWVIAGAALHSGWVLKPVLGSSLTLELWLVEVIGAQLENQSWAGS